MVTSSPAWHHPLMAFTGTSKFNSQMYRFGTARVLEIATTCIWSSKLPILNTPWLAFQEVRRFQTNQFLTWWDCRQTERLGAFLWSEHLVNRSSRAAWVNEQIPEFFPRMDFPIMVGIWTGSLRLQTGRSSREMNGYSYAWQPCLLTACFFVEVVSYLLLANKKIRFCICGFVRCCVALFGGSPLNLSKPLMKPI